MEEVGFVDFSRGRKRSDISTITQSQLSFAGGQIACFTGKQ